MPVKVTIPIGTRFGKLVVVAFHGKTPRGRRWECRCDCGRTVLQSVKNLNYGVQSCGCRQREIFTTHGKSKHPAYQIWKHMLSRCLDPRDHSYPNYGGRGITVDPAWMRLARFVEDMGPRPSLDHTLERIDNNGPYAPGNCRWATRTEQALNRRSNRLLTLNGRTLHLSEWADALGVNESTIRSRLTRGWSVERALTV